MLGFPIYTRDKESPRAYRWIWFIRIFQIVVTLIVLGITAANTASFGSASCGVPSKLAWNLACAVLALLALGYFLLSTGPGRIFKILPWWIFIQLGLDALMLIFWLSAAATSHYNCNDLCNACSGRGSVSFDGLACDCFGDYYYYYMKREMSPVTKSPLLEKRRSHGGASPNGTADAKRALDAIMTILFFVTLVSTIAWIFQNRRAASRNTTATPATGQTANPEAGANQVPFETKQDDTYYNPNSGVPPMQQPQPAMQHGNYGPVSPQQDYPSQYPPQQQGGYPPQYPQQGYPQQGYPQQQTPQPMANYAGPQQGMQPGPMSPPAQQQQTPEYPTPTPEMQAEKREM